MLQKLRVGHGENVSRETLPAMRSLCLNGPGVGYFVFHVKHRGVKSQVSANGKEQEHLIESAAKMGVAVSEAQARLLISHLELVLDWNTRVNLTAITDRPAALMLHVVDSLAAVPFLTDCRGKVADLGTGAGYPGIPIAIVGERPVDLIESVGKKCEFLERSIELLGGLHGSRIVRMRAEELATGEHNAYQVVVARAVSSLPSLVELASPLLQESGLFIAMKGAPSARELESGAIAADIVGMEAEPPVEYVLPWSEEARSIICYRKVGVPNLKLPRRTGVAQKRPLA